MQQIVAGNTIKLFLLSLFLLNQHIQCMLESKIKDYKQKLTQLLQKQNGHGNVACVVQCLTDITGAVRTFAIERILSSSVLLKNHPQEVQKILSVALITTEKPSNENDLFKNTHKLLNDIFEKHDIWGTTTFLEALSQHARNFITENTSALVIDGTRYNNACSLLHRATKNEEDFSFLLTFIIKTDYLSGYNDLSSHMVNIPDIFKATPLFLATYQKKFGAVKKLIQAGADPTQPCTDGYTPLHLVVIRKDPLMLPLFISNIQKNNRNINQPNADQFTALHRAIMAGDYKTATKLINAGADVNVRTKSGETPLMYAAEKGQIEFIDFLIRNGADPTRKSERGYTAWHYTGSYHIRELIRNEQNGWNQPPKIEQ